MKIKRVLNKIEKTVSLLFFIGWIVAIILWFKLLDLEDTGKKIKNWLLELKLPSVQRARRRNQRKLVKKYKQVVERTADLILKIENLNLGSVSELLKLELASRKLILLNAKQSSLKKRLIELDVAQEELDQIETKAMRKVTYVRILKQANRSFIQNSRRKTRMSEPEWARLN